MKFTAQRNPKPVAKNTLQIRREQRLGGYILRAAIPAAALTGFDPDQYPRLGFSYAVTDRELGWQTFAVGAEFPFTSDPSLWGSLELVS